MTGIVKTDPSRPFSVAILRSILDNVLKQPQTKPGKEDLETLANSLNRIHSAFSFATKTGNQSKSTAGEVRGALQILVSFFEKRKQACYPEGRRGPGDQIVEDERVLYDKFQSLSRAMETHDFQLDMDAGLLMPHLDSWRPIAELIAGAFSLAMGRQFGRSNNGPSARFVAAVVPLMTQEQPSVENVGKHLKAPRAHAPRRRREIGTNEK
jgi:hypothetical protein